ncbi:uncharacterized protein METZ01_LOCUS160578 [marine metagenome]|uniref:Uncharacterized protein n=1 Tax=marine metagenome TaxID=408172 RepID=A0A382B294_9ZZZZ
MAISAVRYDSIKEKWGHRVSWAVWADDPELPQKISMSGCDDISIFDRHENPMILDICNPEVIFLALNFSKDKTLEPFENFHSESIFKLRYALQNSIFYGGYMTDFVKDFPSEKGSEAMEYLKQNKNAINENVKRLEEEIESLGSENPIIIVLYKKIEDIIKTHFGDRYQVVYAPHYAGYRQYASAEMYRLGFMKNILDAELCNPWDDPIGRWVAKY